MNPETTLIRCSCYGGHFIEFSEWPEVGDAGAEAYLCAIGDLERASLFGRIKRAVRYVFTGSTGGMWEVVITPDERARLREALK